ncbi:MAG: efflux RND transporter periplasmic adaptor subunit [Parvibaculaceae bacterium]
MRKSFMSFARSAAAVLFLSLPVEAFAQAANGPVPVTVAKPVVREIVEDDEFIGRFEAVDQVTVRSRVGGYLDKVHFRDGSVVNAGDLLFTIDQRPFQAALEQAKASLNVAKTLVDFTKVQFDRAEKLSQSGNIPVATLDDRRREYLSAVAQVDGAQAAVVRAELDLEYTDIKAPLSGRIDRRLVSVGNLVQADQTALTTINSLDPINFYFDVDERQFLAYARDARSRKESLQEGAGGLDVTVRLADDMESPVTGKLDFAENRIDQATGTMRIRAQIPNKDLILQPGLFGRVNMPGSLPYQGILLPDDAIGADQDRRIVYVVDDAGKVSAKPIRLGPKLHGYRVVRSGLTGNETIVINGLMRIRPGVTVKPELVTLPPEAASGASQ